VELRNTNDEYRPACFGKTLEEVWDAFVVAFDEYAYPMRLNNRAKVYFRSKPEFYEIPDEEKIDLETGKCLEYEDKYRVYCRLLISDQPEKANGAA